MTSANALSPRHLSVRMATPPDAALMQPLLKPLIAESLGDTPGLMLDEVVETQLRPFARGNSITRFLLAIWDKQPVGMVSVTPQNQQAEINSLVVDKTYQSKGIGSKLLLQAEELARSLGAKLVHLSAKAHRQSFYLQRGYHRVKTPVAIWRYGWARWMQYRLSGVTYAFEKNL